MAFAARKPFPTTITFLNMRRLKRFLKWVLGIIIFTFLGLYITGYGYIIKGVWVVYLHGHTTAFIDDYTFFENDTIEKSTNPQPWPNHTKYNTVKPTELLSETNKNLGTVAFLILKNDSIFFEEYYEGYDKNSISNSFSMAKSVVSALLGKAIKDGFITSLSQEVSDFYPQFKNSGLTVGDLSSMASGLDWKESYGNPFSITARSYYDDDLANIILGLKVVEEPGKSYKYLSGNPQLLAMVLQKATGKKLSAYLSEEFTQPMGFENTALWQVDNAKNRLVKAYCCIGSNARDFARFGKLYKDFGKWNGEQILDSTFVVKSINPRFPESPEYGYGFWLSDYLGKKIFVMRGILGQYVIVVPEDDVIIVRLGKNRGSFIDKPFTDDFYVYIDEAYKMLH